MLVFSGMTSAIMAESCKVGSNKLQSEVPETGPGEAVGDLGQLYVHFRGLSVFRATAPSGSGPPHSRGF